MTIARSVADVLAEHVVFEVGCIDRMYLNVYVPKLQHPGGLLGYVQRQLDLPIASTAPLAKITDRFSSAVHRFAEREDIPWVDFKKGQRKDDVMGERLASFTAAEGVVFIGRAQEKTPLFRTEKRRDREGRSYPCIVKSTGVVNQFYYYCVDADFGPFFLKFCSYFPFNGKLCINGNHWAQRQAAKAGIGFTPLDNAFAAVEDPAALQAICDQLGPDQIDALLRKWLAILPHPFTPADRAAGYRYDLSILQAEFSLTQTLDRPVSGRIFFEHVICDNLDTGRPDQVSLIFNRRLKRTGPRATPARFRTRLITDGVTPGLRLGQQRSHALLAALLLFRLQPNGFRNTDMRTLAAQLRGLPAHDVSPGQITYDLRRLRVRGLIERIPHSHRYRVTDLGLHTAMLITRVQERLLPTGLAHLTDPSATTSPLRTAARAYEAAIDNLIQTERLAA